MRICAAVQPVSSATIASCSAKSLDRLASRSRSQASITARRRAAAKLAAAPPVPPRDPAAEAAARFAAWLAERERDGLPNGAPRHRHSWCAAEDAWLGEHARRPLAEQARRLGRTAAAIEARWVRLGLVQAPAVPHA
jgi:hypothetical protein